MKRAMGEIVGHRARALTRGRLDAFPQPPGGANDLGASSLAPLLNRRLPRVELVAGHRQANDATED
jgi:hypothetical protein